MAQAIRHSHKPHFQHGREGFQLPHLLHDPSLLMAIVLLGFGVGLIAYALFDMDHPANGATRLSDPASISYD